MASSSFILFLLSQLSLQYTISLHVQAQAVKPDPEKCAPSYCPNISTAIQFPFSNITNKECGLYYISCNNNPSLLKIKFEEKGKPFVVKTISYEGKQMVIQDDRLLKIERSDDVCNNLYNYTIPTSPHLSFQLEAFNYTFLRCKRGHYTPPPVILQPYNYTECQDHILYYSKDKRLKELQHNCDVVEYPLSEAQVDPYGSKQDLLRLFLTTGFGLKWKLTDDCEECHTKRRGFCKLRDTDGKFFCYGKEKCENKD